MAIRDLFKFSRKTFIDPKGWIDYDSLKYHNGVIWDTLKNSFTIPKPERQETFEKAVSRLNLSKSEIHKTARLYRYYALAFLMLGLVVILYTLYILFRHGTFTGLLLGVAATGVLLSQAFRYDFWSLQMRRQRLGLTFADWKDSYFGQKRTSA